MQTTAGKTKVVKISGNSASTYSEGKCCSRSHIGLQVLYNPDRFQTPLRRREGTTKGRDVNYDADFESISWETALQDVASKLSTREKPLILQGLNTTSNEDLIHQFALACGTRNLFNEEGLETDADREGKRMADGRVNQGYELVSEDGTSTKYILAFSSGIVESERPLARNLRLWGKLRRELPNKRKVVAFDPRYSVTASRSAEWVPINPRSEGALAMAIAHVILSEGLYDPDLINDHTTTTLNKISRVLNQYGKTTVTVTGHTDNVGSDAFNQTLSEKRAQSVLDHFASQNVNPVRLTVYGRGESEPRADNATEAGRQLNRRVELLIQPVVAN